MKCFGHAVSAPLTETEARLFYTKVFDATGLVVGWKSIKNYSGFLFSAAASGKAENPSVATLDTLARYVAGAPYTTEPERKAAAGHYPYWYGYREKWVALHGGVRGGGAAAPEVTVGRRKTVWRLFGRIVAGVMVVAVLLAIAVIVWLFRGSRSASFRDDFHMLAADSLAARGWWVVAPDTVYWGRRGEWRGGLTLFTMEGDNWPDPAHVPVIRNLLRRRIPCDCFTLEWHLNRFIPGQNWQQAGVLLSEDTGFTARSMRVSIEYNDYNGVYPRSGSIYLQAITSQSGGKPEEIAQVPLFSADSLRRNPALARDLEHTALRIEKRGDRFRILYADGILANTSFRQIASYELPVRFRYVGLFALRGFVDSGDIMPARFSYFSLDCTACGGH